jgi:ATP-dependent Clp endopeptidase proteolytic subunit ClpP
VKRIDIKGAIIPNDYKWYYDYLEMDSTTPKDVYNILGVASNEPLEVYINSPGGVIDVGSEIYTMLRSHQGNVNIYIVGEACSAASIIAMARHCEMAPTALMMVHCVSTGAQGNHSDFEKTAEVLRIADDALSNAYVIKSGMSKEEALLMMEKETWLTADQALEKGLIDGIMFEEKNNLSPQLVAGNFVLPSQEKMDQIKKMINEQDTKQSDAAFLMSKIKNLRLKER